MAMRVKDRLQVMIIPPSTGGVRQYSVPQWIVPAALGAVALLILFTAMSGIFAFRSWSSKAELAAQVEENHQLQDQIAQLDQSVDVLRGKLVALESAEQDVRSVFGFPELDPDERALGIGGGVSEDESGFSAVDQAAFALETDLDRLLRRCEFERENFSVLYTALVERKDRLDHTPSINPVGGHLVRGFGIKADPFTGRDRLHGGLDLSANIGTPVRAPADGRVTSTGYKGQLGKMIELDHGFGMETRYGHLSKIAVKRGEAVTRGQIIGYAGNTGYSTGPHLHYEVSVNGKRVDPMKYIYDFGPWVSEPLAQVDMD